MAFRQGFLPCCALSGAITTTILIPLAHATSDITTQILANQDVTLSGDAVINLSGGTTTYSATNGISGTGTLTINGPGTLVLEQANHFSLPTINDVVTRSTGHATVSYEGYLGSAFGGQYFTVTANDPPAVTVGPGATLQLGDLTSTAGTIEHRDPGSGYNLDGILDNGTVWVDSGQPALANISGTGSLVIKRFGATSPGLFLEGNNTFSGVLINDLGLNLGTDHVGVSLPNASAIFNNGTLLPNVPFNQQLILNQNIYESHFGGDINTGNSGGLIALNGVYTYSDSGNEFAPSLTLTSDNYTYMKGNASARGINQYEILRLGDGTSTNFALPGNPYNTYFNHYKGVLAFDYANTGPTYINNIISGGGVTFASFNGAPGDGVVVATQGHFVITHQQFYNGTTQIDSGAIIQLGDGTTGDLQVIGAGDPNKGHIYESSGGDGLLFEAGQFVAVGTDAKGNSYGQGSTSATGAAGNNLVDNGALVVNNRGATALLNISGNGQLIQAGAGVTTLFANTLYTGATTIAGGTLAIGAGGSVATSSNLNLLAPGSSPVPVYGPQAGQAGFNSLPIGYVAASVATPGAAIFDISQGGNQTIQDLSGISGTTVALGGNTLTLGTANSTTFAGAIVDGGIGGGTGGSLTKVGSGVLTLGGSSTYTGPTTIAAGAIRNGQDNALPATSSLNIGSGALYDLVGFQQTVGSLTGAGSVTNSSTNPSVFTLGKDNTSTVFSGTITDGGAPVSLVKTGNGTLTLNGANTYTGLTDVQAGALAVGDADNPGAGIGGSARVEPDAMLMGHGTIGGSLTNLGTVRPGGSIGTLTIGGDYAQNQNATLLIEVSPQAASLLRVNGRASLAGTATFLFAPGTYQPTTYTFVSATQGVSGQFSQIATTGAVPSGYESSIAYTSTTADLLLGLSPSTSAGKPTHGSSPSLTVVAPANGTIFTAQAFQLATAADQATRTLLGRPGAIDPTACVGPQAWNQLGATNGVTTGTDAAEAIGSAFCQMGGWVRASGTLLTVKGSSSTGFQTGNAALIAGLDRPVGPYGTILGLSIGTDQGWLSDFVNGRATVSTVRLGLYGIQNAGPFVVNGALAYAYNYATTNRATEVGQAHEGHAGGIVSGGIQAGLPAKIAGLSVTPAIGLRGALIDEGGFTEVLPASESSFAVNASGIRQTNLQPYGQITFARPIALANGGTLTPKLTIGYAYQVGEPSATAHLMAPDGTLFQLRDRSFGRYAADVSLGLTYVKNNLAFFADYALLAGSNWRAQNFALGVRSTF